MISLIVGICTASLIMMALVTVLVAWTVRREEKAATMTAKPPGRAARVVRHLLGLHVTGYSFAPGEEDGAPQRHRPGRLAQEVPHLTHPAIRLIQKLPTGIPDDPVAP
jgi:hypothetical protein